MKIKTNLTLLRANEQRLRAETAEREKANTELRRREERFRTLVENLPQKIFLKDKNSVYMSCNENYARDLKTKPDEIVGKADYDFYPKELAEKYRADDKRIMGSKKGEDLEEKYIQDGQERWVHTVKVPVRDENGNITGILGIFWDITERKKVDDALRKQTHDLAERVKELDCLYGIAQLVEKPGVSLEEIIQGTAGLAPSGWQYPEITCARVTIDGEEYKTANFKKSPWRQVSDIVVNGEKKGILEVYYLEEKPEIDEGPFLKEERNLINTIAEHLGRIIERNQAEEELKSANQQLQASEQQLKASNQQLRAGEQQLKASNQQLGAGEQQLRASNQQLRASEQQLRAETAEREKAEDKIRSLSSAVQQSPSIAVITGTNGDIEYVNPKFSQITGYAYEETIGKNPRILKSGETTLEEYKVMWGIIISGGEWRGIFHNKKKSGELYWEAASISSIKDAEGAITHFVKVAEDITERKKMEEETKKHLHDLEVFYKANIGREERVVELKKRVRELEAKLGKKTG